MKTTIEIDEDIFRTATERAEAMGRTTEEVISDMVRYALALDTINRLPKRNGFPQLELDPNIVVTPELIDQILDEDD